GDGTASVSWPVPSDGGSAITGYIVWVFGGGAILLATPTPDQFFESLTFPADTTTATIDGLVDGTRYTFYVRATNALGASDFSPESAGVVPQAGAAPPQTEVQVVPASGGSETTDPAGTGPSVTDPVTTSIAVPATSGGGVVSIA